MPTIATRIFQFILLVQTIAWAFAYIGQGSMLGVYVNRSNDYWVISYVVILSLAIFDKYLTFFSWLVQIVSCTIYSKKLLKVIKNLKPQDKLILSKFVIENKRELFLNSLDENTEWLASNKIIIRTGSTADKKDGYKLAIWSRDYLTKNPNLLY